MNRPQQVSQAPEKCASCEGTGKLAVAAGYGVSCLVCGGKGSIMVAQPAGACHQCMGSGRRSATALCLACAGTGWMRVVIQG
ncbi:MAG: transcriptional regulator [Pyrinomonadaceae bacterium]|nr:transcriptional regulator [Pyrinomonadaceae bacterium]